MASIQYTDPSYDYTHMYNIKDLRGNLPQPVYNQGTIICALHEHRRNDCIALIAKAGMAGIFNDKQAAFTVFVGPIDPQRLDQLDSFKAKQLVLYHTLQYSVRPSIMKSSKAMYVNTLVPGSKILVENLTTPTPQLNRCARVIGCPLIIGCATIYFIDKMLHLDSNPLSNIDI